MDLTESTLVNAPKCILAIDPGLSGAAFKLGRGVFEGYRDFQVCPEIALAVKTLTTDLPAPNYAVIEAVHAFPGQGVCSVWSFAEATGYAKAALCLTLPNARVLEVAPQSWQKDIRLVFKHKGEFDSREIALKLFPTYADWFKRKMDHNSADAVLMAVWGLLPTLQSKPVARA